MSTSLFIGFVTPNVTVSQLEHLFEDTFGAQVFVRFSKQCKNVFGTQFKSASIEVFASSPSLEHFLSQVKVYGNNTFIGDGNTYKVQFADTDQEKEKEKEVKRVVPRIM
jgi:hypothetical protein